MTRLRFPHSRGGVLAIGPEALATLLSFRQLAPDATEAGGILLGRYLRDGYDIIIDRVTVPMASDEQRRFSFFRSADHQQAIDEAWESSGGTCCYIGEWHTHAEPHPTPSGIDLDNWQQRLARDTLPDEAAFFLIIGQESIGAWEGDVKTCSVRKLAEERRAA